MCVGVSVWLGWGGIRVAGFSRSQNTPKPFQYTFLNTVTISEDLNLLYFLGSFLFTKDIFPYVGHHHISQDFPFPRPAYTEPQMM
jgi:hypothetical protein